MLLSFYSLIRRDKYIEHPVIGSVTCSGYQEAFKKCSELLNNNSSLNVQCYTLFEISLQCFKTETDEEFVEWIDKQVEERKRLNDHLKKSESVLPKLQQKHMVYDIFIASEQQNDSQVTQDAKRVKDFYEKELLKNRNFYQNNNQQM